MEFPPNFKKLRMDLGLNQTDYGKIFGLSQRVISDLEKGKSNPSKTLLAYLKYRWGHIFSDRHEDLLQKKQLSHFEHEKVIRGFKNKDLAKDINVDLLKLEEIEPGKLREVHAYIKGMIVGIMPEYGSERRDGTDRRQSKENYIGDERRDGMDRRKNTGT